jgi:hypothetical protein
MSVDFPRPVWPERRSISCTKARGSSKLTNADDVELEAPLDALLLNLLGDAVEADIAVREDGLCLVGGGHCGRLDPRGRMRRGRECCGGGIGRRRRATLGCCCDGKIQGRCNFLVELQLRERGQPRSVALERVREGALELRLGCQIVPTPPAIATRETARPHAPPLLVHSTHDGARPPASAAVADTAACPQWAHPAYPGHSIPATPLTALPHTPHAIRRVRDTVHMVPVLSVAERDLGRRLEGSAQEEDVISQEAPTVHGGQRTEGHHGAD